MFVLEITFSDGATHPFIRHGRICVLQVPHFRWNTFCGVTLQTFLQSTSSPLLKRCRCEWNTKRFQNNTIIQNNISPNIGDGPNFIRMNRPLELFLLIRVRFNTDHLFDWLINQFKNVSRHTYIVLTMGE